MTADYVKLFKNFNFLYIWSSQILSQLTINILNFLILIKLFQETSSRIATAMLWVSIAIPAIIVGPFASASVDLFDKKKILIITNLLQAITIFVYAIGNLSSIFLLYIIAFTYSLLNQFYVPAELATIPTVVKTESLSFANGLFLFTQQGSMIVGFAVAGLLKNFIGFRSSIIVCSLYLFLAFLSVLKLPSMRPKVKIRFKGFEDAFAEFFLNIAKGYKFIRGNPKIFMPLSLLIGIQIIVAVMAVNTPIIAKQLINISLDFAAALLIVPAGVGALVGSLIIPRMIKKGVRKVRIIKFFLITIAISFFILSAFVGSVSQIISLGLTMILIFTLGVSFMGINIPAQTFLQEKTPGGYRGRVFGNFWFLTTIANVIPVIISGLVSELFGARFLVFLILAIFTIVYFYVNNYSTGLIGNGAKN